MKKLLLLLAITIVSCSTPSITEEPYIITPPALPEWTLIPDLKFETALISLGHDNLLDGKVLTSNISLLRSIRLEHLRIENISGIESFINLETLLLWDNDFTSINLRSLKKLKLLGLSECPLTILDLSQNTELVELDFQNNSQRISDPTYEYGKTKGLIGLDLTYNTKLERIYLWVNRITSLDVSNCPRLTDLWLGVGFNNPNGGNPIQHLDLSENPILNVIVLDGCDLRTLNIKNTANNGVPRTCSTSNNPNLYEIKVNNVNLVNSYRASTNNVGNPISTTYWKKDTQTIYVQ
jgi:hypothetical protein